MQVKSPFVNSAEPEFRSLGRALELRTRAVDAFAVIFPFSFLVFAFSVFACWC